MRGLFVCRRCNESRVYSGDINVFSVRWLLIVDIRPSIFFVRVFDVSASCFSRLSVLLDSPSVPS